MTVVVVELLGVVLVTRVWEWLVTRVFHLRANPNLLVLLRVMTSIHVQCLSMNNIYILTICMVFFTVIFKSTIYINIALNYKPVYFFDFKILTGRTRNILRPVDENVSTRRISRAKTPDTWGAT